MQDALHQPVPLLDPINRWEYPHPITIELSALRVEFRARFGLTTGYPSDSIYHYISPLGDGYAQVGGGW
jgi:hypothetical protein